MRVVQSQTVTSGDMRCSLRCDPIPLRLLYINGVSPCRIYSNQGLSGRRSNSRRVQGHQVVATLALHRAGAMLPLLMMRRMMTCTRSSVWRIDTSRCFVIPFFVTTQE